MTTKRFTILYGLDEDPFDWDILDNEKDAIICQYNGTPICELLNELHEENEQLRHDATILIQSNQDYRKENEQLKEQLMDCEKFRHTVFQEISKEMNKHD